MTWTITVSVPYGLGAVIYKSKFFVIAYCFEMFSFSFFFFLNLWINVQQVSLLLRRTGVVSTCLLKGRLV